jgi:K+-sensing histidine kinase KdpD
MAKAPEYAIAKLAPPEANALAYPNHDRANDVYSMWMSGYTEDEVADFTQIDVAEVKKDLMYVNTKLTTRQIIAHNNDRSRIMLQRNESENFRNMMRDALGVDVRTLLAAGVSPAGILKEFREATGMVQKAEPLLQINTQINQASTTTGGITSAEDVIRRVLNQINQDTPPPEESEVIDAEIVDPEESPGDPDTDHVPEPDD